MYVYKLLARPCGVRGGSVTRVVSYSETFVYFTLLYFMCILGTCALSHAASTMVARTALQRREHTHARYGVRDGKELEDAFPTAAFGRVLAARRRRERTHNVLRRRSANRARAVDDARDGGDGAHVARERGVRAEVCRDAAGDHVRGAAEAEAEQQQHADQRSTGEALQVPEQRTRQATEAEGERRARGHAVGRRARRHCSDELAHVEEHREETGGGRAHSHGDVQEDGEPEEERIRSLP